MTIGIIGYGSFGSFLAGLASKHLPKSTVRIFSRRHEPDGVMFFSFADVCKADVVIPAVPIGAYEKTLETIAAHCSPETVVVDVATVKVYTLALLQRHTKSFTYIATHPMFGPFSYEKRGKSFSGLRIVLCERTISEEKYQKLKSFLRGLGLSVVEMSADDHDKEVAHTLFLAHLIAQTITEGGFHRTDIDTVSFGYLMDAVESVMHDMALFRDVYRFNRYCEAALERFSNAELEVERRLKAD